MSEIAVPAAASAPAPRRRPKLSRKKIFRRVLPWLVIAALFLLWQAFVDGFRIASFVLPSPSEIFSAGWQWRGIILQNAWLTFVETAIGFFFAIVFGLSAGIAVGSSSLIYDGFYPALVGFNTIPKVAVVPILII